MGKNFSLYNDDPRTLDQDSLLAYKEAVCRYPFCQYAHLMFLLNLKQLNDTHTFSLTLPHTAITLPDRVRLKEQVDRLQPNPPIREQKREQTDTDRYPRTRPYREADSCRPLRNEPLPRRKTEGFSPWSQALPQSTRRTPIQDLQAVPDYGSDYAPDFGCVPENLPDSPFRSEESYHENPGFRPIVEPREKPAYASASEETLRNLRSLINGISSDAKTENIRQTGRTDSVISQNLKNIRTECRKKTVQENRQKEEPARNADRKTDSPRPGNRVSSFSARRQSDAIIDRFIKGGEHYIALDEDFDYASFDPDMGYSTREDFSFGSETLAEMYLKNNAPQKAIEVYRHLGLKFPEKSRYFANLIQKVKKDYSIK